MMNASICMTRCVYIGGATSTAVGGDLCSRVCGFTYAAVSVTPQPHGDLSSCQRGVTGCHGDVTEMSRICHEMSRRCRGDVAEMSRDVAGCRRMSPCREDVARCRRCREMSSGCREDVAKMSRRCREMSPDVTGRHQASTSLHTSSNATT